MCGKVTCYLADGEKRSCATVGFSQIPPFRRARLPAPPASFQLVGPSVKLLASFAARSGTGHPASATHYSAAILLWHAKQVRGIRVAMGPQGSAALHRDSAGQPMVQRTGSPYRIDYRPLCTVDLGKSTYGIRDNPLIRYEKREPFSEAESL